VKESIKKKLLVILRISGFVLFYSIVLVASIFFTMSLLIKGKEIEAPDLVGKHYNEVKIIASTKGVLLKKIEGKYDKHFKPLTVINQFPAPGVKIKEKSTITIFVSSELVEVIMPDLTAHNLQESEKILRDNTLRKRYVSYINAGDVPVDTVIAQSVPADARIPSGSEIDLLVSKGVKNKVYIMPDLIAQKVDKVVYFFEEIGFKISKITPVSYPGSEPGIIVNQFPELGFPINKKTRISIEVSE
jgi:serine/threonine-protein kinase